MNCGIGRDCGSNLIPGLETPQAAGMPKMKKKRKRKKWLPDTSYLLSHFILPTSLSISYSWPSILAGYNLGVEELSNWPRFLYVGSGGARTPSRISCLQNFCTFSSFTPGALDSPWNTATWKHNPYAPPFVWVSKNHLNQIFVSESFCLSIDLLTLENRQWRIM